MTKIVLQDGKVLLVDGKVADGTACCCVTPCVCPECDEGVTLDVDGVESECSDGVYSTSYSGAGDNTHGGLSATLYCETDTASQSGIIWRVAVTNTFANFTPGSDFEGLYCNKWYEGTVAADANCLPTEGEVSLTVTDSEDGGACNSLGDPVVTVLRV